MLACLVVVLTASAIPSVRQFGVHFLVSQDWRPNEVEQPKKGPDGKCTETPEELFTRVAHTVAGAEARYGKKPAEIAKIEKEYIDMMVKGIYMPNSPTLMNAGREIQCRAILRFIEGDGGNAGTRRSRRVGRKRGDTPKRGGEIALARARQGRRQ